MTQETQIVAPIATKAPLKAAGIKLKPGLLSKDALRSAHLDWEVATTKMYYGVGDSKRVVDDRKAVIRTDNDGYIGTVGNHWHPIQNINAFEWMDSIFGSQKDVFYEKAGEFGGGKIVFLQLKTATLEVRKGDTIDAYVDLSNRHDGSGGLQVNFGTFRLWCANQLNNPRRFMGDVNKGIQKRIRFTHTLNVLNRMELAKDLVLANNEAFKKFHGAAKLLASMDVKKTDVEAFLKRLDIEVSGKKATTDKDGKAEEIRSVKDRRHNKIIELFETGRGNHLPGVRGTMWALLNGVTEYVDHYAEIKKGDHKDKDSARQYQSLYGWTAGLKDRAFEVALEMASK